MVLHPTATTSAPWLRTLDEWEASLLHHVMVPATHTRMRALARVVNFLGNGWLFAMVAIAMPLFGGAMGWSFVRTVAVSLAVCFSVYPFIKRLVARVRPCHASEHFDAGVRPLDRYSCPSGHSMTAAIFVLPLILLFPIGAPLLLAVWVAIGWSRLALGHHYPSDVLLGGAMGLVVSGVVALWLR